MKKYLKYLKYLLKHKIFVTQECFKRGLIWQGILHDLSKFLPSEFFPYARHFFKEDKPKREKTGYYKPINTGNSEFDFAWFLHQKRNKHHWQWWIQPDDYEGVVILPMKDKYILEMFCDWLGASRAQGFESGTVDQWYKNNGPKLQLHPESRKKIEKILDEWKCSFGFLL